MSENPVNLFSDIPVRILNHIASTDAILFHRAIAEKLGLKATDYRCLLFLMDGPKTAGELAGMLGLTTGSITAVMARLEKRQFIRRGSDRSDKRKVIIESIPQNLKPLYGGLAEFVRAMRALDERYSANEIAIINDYMNRAANILHEHTQQAKV